MSNLSEKMQERLEKWRKSTVPLTAKPKVSSKNYVARGDYGDDIRDFERKDHEAWMRQIESEPVYRGYR